MECATMTRSCLKPPLLQDVKLKQSRLRPDEEAFDFGAARKKEKLKDFFFFFF